MKATIITYLFLFSFINYGNSQSFIENSSLSDSSTHQLSLNISATTFIKNNEYINQFVLGYTGIGFFTKPTFEYYLTPNTKVNAGVYLLKYSGINTFSQVIPVFSIQHRLTKNLDIILGNIYGTTNHKLKEPIFRQDRYYKNNVEYGLQLLWKSKYITSDLWVNWERYIFDNDPFQEELFAGSASCFKLYSNSNFEFNIPLQLVIAHKGGQIDSSSNRISSLANMVTGLEIDYKIAEKQKISFESLLFSYRGISFPETGINSQLFKNGNAIYLKLKYQNSFMNAMVGYWKANQFIAPRGEYLFHSVSEFKNDYSKKNRSLVTSKIVFTKKISKVFQISFHTDLYYDLNASDLAYSNGLYLIMNESFFIKKLNKHIPSDD